MPQKKVMKVIFSLFAFIFCFFIMNFIIVSIIGYAEADAFLVISEFLSGNTLAETGRGIVSFVKIMLIVWDGIVGLIGALGMYHYLADRILDLFPLSFDGDE